MVERAPLGEQAIVVGVQARELELAAGVNPLGVRLAGATELGRVATVVAAGDQLVLQAIDTRDEARQERCRVAADLVAAEGQVVDPVEHQRQPVGRRHRGEERVEPGLDRLVVQDARAEVVEGHDAQVLEGRVEARLEPLADLRGRRGGEGEGEDRVGGRAVLREPLEARHQRACLAGARAADHEQRPSGVPGGLDLSLREAGCEGRHRA